MYDVLSTKILQGSDTASRAVLQKRCSKISDLNLGLIYKRKVEKFISKPELFKRCFSKILMTTITTIA